MVDRVGTITLNRPERHNALNGELIGVLDAAVRQLAADDEAKEPGYRSEWVTAAACTVL